MAQTDFASRLQEQAKDAVSDAIILLTEYECGDMQVWKDVVEAKANADGLLRDLHHVFAFDLEIELEAKLKACEWKP